MTTNLKAYVEVRSQKSRGSGAGKFGGPDTRVLVQVVPDGEEPLKALNHRVADQRGIELIYCGEGYHKNRGPRSSLGKALAKAKGIAESINAGNEVTQ